MTDEIEIKTDAEIAMDMLDAQTNGATIAELASKYEVSVRTVNNRLKMARDAFYKELEEEGSKLASAIWKKYEVAERELWLEWQTTRDPAIVGQWRNVMKDMREMFKLDKAPKAPVNSQGQVVPNTLVFVMNDDKFKEIEKKQGFQIESPKSPIVDAEFSDTIDSKGK